MSNPLDAQQTLDVQQTLDHCMQAMKSASKAMAVNGWRAGTPAVLADGLAVAGSRVVLPWCIGRAEAAASIGPGPW
jgi:hypothetical protein